MSDSDTNTDKLIERELTDAVRAFEPPPELKAAVRERISATAADARAPRRGVFRRRLSGSLGVAAAAVLIAAVILHVLPNGGSSDTAYAQLAEAIRHGQAAKWVHLVYTGNAGRRDMWVRFRPFRRLAKSKTEISAVDAVTGIEHSYDVGKNVLTIRPWSTPAELRYLHDAHQVMQETLDSRKAHGFRIRTGSETIGATEFTVFTVVNGEGQDHERWLVDKKTGLVVLFEELDPEGTGGCPARMTFDYPDEGPADVYALGVPRNAKVIDLTRPVSPAAAAAAHAELAAAIRKARSVAWVHTVYTGNAGRTDTWLFFRRFKRFEKSASEISAVDAAAGTEQTYDLERNVLSTRSWRRPSGEDGADDLRRLVREKLEERKAKGWWVRKTDEILGFREFTVFSMVDPRGGDTERWLVDKQTGLPALFEELDPEREDHCPARMTFDYPDTGPADIHALGVPRDAKVVDLRTAPATRPARAPK